MSYREENGQVILSMSREDFQMLLLYLGYATGGAVKYHWTPPARMLEFLNRINEGNPHYTPYQVEKKC
jgi:hypothetical protein